MKELISMMCLKTNLHQLQQRKNNWKLKIGWAGSYKNKKSDWFVWLIFKILDISHRSSKYLLSFISFWILWRSKVISTFSMSVKSEKLGIALLLKKSIFYVDAEDATPLVWGINLNRNYISWVSKVFFAKSLNLCNLQI